jgi:hypothetical protein
MQFSGVTMLNLRREQRPIVRPPRDGVTDADAHLEQAGRGPAQRQFVSLRAQPAGNSDQKYSRDNGRIGDSFHGLNANTTRQMNRCRSGNPSRSDADCSELFFASR